MTQFSDRTNAQGQWGLPGGGIEPEEAPDRAVVREVWEESGQVIEVGELALVHTSHWIGRAPSGRLEDFHAVRLVYRASVTRPSLLFMTSGARRRCRRLRRRTSIGSRSRPAGGRCSGLVMAPDEADGPEHDKHEADADDRARPQP